MANESPEITDEMNFIQEKLSSWGLSKYVDDFIKHEIDREQFLSLPKKAISKVITNVGAKYKFFKFRDRYLAISETSQIENFDLIEPDIPVGESTSTQASTSTVALSEKTTINDATPHIINTSQLKDILQQSAEGRRLLTEKVLDKSLRYDLVGEIVNYLLNQNISLDKTRFLTLTKQIVELFEYELASGYYTPAKDSRPATGKLFNKYNNEKKKLRSYLKREKNEAVATNLEPEELGEDHTELLISLKATALDDHSKWRIIWRKTHNLRNRSQTISEYFQEYPVLRTSIGASLLSIDFECLNISDPNILFKKWPLVSKYIVMQSKKIRACADVLSKNENLSTELLAFVVLPYMFKTTFYKNPKKKNIKTTSQEQANSFILWINTTVDMSRRITQQRKQLEEYGMTFQPTVISIGPPENISKLFVMVNDVKFEFSELIATVDFCFKAFYALNASYPIQGQSLWSFLQSYIYEIPETKKEIISVNELISDLRFLSTREKVLEKETTEADELDSKKADDRTLIDSDQESK